MLNAETVISAAARTPRKTARPKSRRKQSTSPTAAPTQADLAALTHTQLTQRYNALVPAALALGITVVEKSRVRVHTSAFISKEAGVRITAALEAAVVAAKPRADAAPRPRRSRRKKV